MNDKTSGICPFSEFCGGCEYQGLSYEKQLEKKQKRVDKLFSSICRPEKILGMQDPLHYRNKVQVTFGKDDDHRMIMGNYAKDSHFIVPVDDCMICDEGANEILSSIKKILIKYRVSVFDERALKGTIRHVLIRSTSLGEYMVVLVTGNTRLRNEKEIVRDILKYNSQVTTILQNYNGRHTSMILGEKTEILYGRGYVIDELMGCRFRISASSFYQINKRQTEILYGKAVEYAGLSGKETLIDAYCGTGTIGILMSRNAKKVYGVELNSRAVKDARKNAEDNHISNIEFINDDAGNYMRELAKKKAHIDTLIMDPPRSGSDERFLSSAVILSPKKIVYVSCCPETLRDDVNYLLKNGYRVEKVQPVDMFPYTDHVESITLLCLK